MRHLAAFLAFVACGYWLRLHAPIPSRMRDVSGGVLYVIALAMLLAACVKRPRPRAIAACALAITSALECLQLWKPAWLQALRHTWFGRLALGTTFNWLDFPPYLLGAWLAFLVLKRIAGAGSRDRAPRRRSQRASRG